ncbi:hypothetical protein ACJJTC_008303 [Scirpophaga incertulas]
MESEQSQQNDISTLLETWQIPKVIFETFRSELKLIFAVLYPDKVNRFKDYWKLFMEHLFELKKAEIQSEENKKNEFMSLCSLDTEDQKLLMELTLLINIIPPKGRVYKTGKFCTQECLDSNTSMIIVENSGDINTHHTEANRKLMFNLTLFFLEPCKKSAKHILSLTILAFGNNSFHMKTRVAAASGGAAYIVWLSGPSPPVHLSAPGSILQRRPRRDPLA